MTGKLAMGFDIIVKGGILPDGRVADIGIAGGKIAAIEPAISADAGAVVEASGNLVSPPFVDPHFHMDATLSYGIPRINASGTLLEGIGLWGELKPLLTHEAVRDRALAYCDWAVSMGLLAIRSHVDTCDDRLLAVEALLDVKKRVAPYLDLQLVAFPQDGFYRSPTRAAKHLRALDLGVDIVGGIPHFERTMEDGRRSVTELCEIAAERGLMVDLHCDETDDPLSRHIEQLAYETQRLGLSGRVAGSHLTSMHSMDNYYVSKLLPLIAEARRGGDPQSADQHRAAGPPRQLSQAPRHDSRARDDQGRHPRRLRPGLRARSLVFAGHGRHARRRLHGPACRADDQPCGHAPLLRHGDHGQCRDHGARRLWAGGGQTASLVVLDAGDPIEAIRLRPERLCVIAKGKIVATRSSRTQRWCCPAGLGA